MPCPPYSWTMPYGAVAAVDGRLDGAEMSPEPATPCAPRRCRPRAVLGDLGDGAAIARGHLADVHGDRGVPVPAVHDRPAVDGDQVPLGEHPVGAGMPCTISSLTDAQITPGKPWSRRAAVRRSAGGRR